MATRFFAGTGSRAALDRLARDWSPEQIVGRLARDRGRKVIFYDPDQIQMLYVTPHRWTPYFKFAADRTVIQPDRRRWDYKHQMLASRIMPAWRVLAWFKFTEMAAQFRPKALWRTWLQPDRGLRHAMCWYTQMGRRVWPYEVFNFFLPR